MEEENDDQKTSIAQKNIKQELPNEQMEDCKEQYIINFVDVDNMKTEVKEENYEVTVNDYKYSEPCYKNDKNDEDKQTTTDYDILTVTRSFEDNIPACSNESVKASVQGNAKHIGLKSITEKRSYNKKTSVSHSNTVASNTYGKQDFTEGNIGSHSGCRYLNCEVCGMCFSYMGSLKSHMNQIHHMQYECKFCKIKFPTSTLFQKHLSDINECKKMYKCELCEKRYLSLGGLNNHMLTSHSSKCYMCDECGKTLSSKLTLKRHMKSLHISKTECKCKRCCEIPNYLCSLGHCGRKWEIFAISSQKLKILLQFFVTK